MAGLGVIFISICICFLFLRKGNSNFKKITDSSVLSQEDFIVVPEIIGQTLQEAKSALNKRGLVVEVIGEEYSNIIPKGKITSQFPQVNDTAIKGTTLKVKISKGAEDKKK